MGSLSALKSMSRAAHSAVEAGLPKPAPESKPATATPRETAKPAVTKTAAPAKKSAGSAVGRSSYAPDAVITVKSNEHGKTGNGKEALDCLKDGMTIEKFRTALEKKGRQGMFAWAVKYAIENKLIVMKEAK